MNVIENQSFIDCTVEMDGKTFINCTFDGCVIRFVGSAVHSAVGCRFDDCGVSFDGAAYIVVMQLRAWISGGGNFGQTIQRILNTPV